jgi:hypothetical protein
MGFFDGFSSRPEADSAALQKPGGKADSWLRKAVFFSGGDGAAPLDPAANGRAPETC